MQYIVKNVGSIGVDKEYNIINTLRKEYESLFLHYCDTKISELSKEYYDELKEEYFEGYCNDTIGLKFEAHYKAKHLIVDYLLENGLLKYKNPIGMDKAEEYYKSMLENRFNMYAYKDVDKIKNIVMEIVFYSESIFKTDFIRKRIVYSNNYYLDEDGMRKEDFTNIWYKPKDGNEFMYALKEDTFYSGIVLNSETEFNDSATSFCKFETASDYDLIIKLRVNEQFSEKTKEIIKEYNLQIVTLWLQGGK